jgi:hypothetical protein
MEGGGRSGQSQASCLLWLGSRERVPEGKGAGTGCTLQRHVLRNLLAGAGYIQGVFTLHPPPPPPTPLLPHLWKLPTGTLRSVFY